VLPFDCSHQKLPLPAGTVIVPVLHTGDFEKKRAPAELIYAIYERLSASAALLPPAIAFSFDREDRTEREIEDATRASQGRAHFLQRRTYENFLLSPSAITALLNHLPSFATEKATAESVATWLSENGGRSKYVAAKGPPTPDGKSIPIDTADLGWQRNVKAPEILKDITAELSGAREKYEKVAHGAWLTRWLLANDPQHLHELTEYLCEIIERQRPS
jgi:hypothetical protein